MTEILAGDVSSDDRRRVVNAGLRTGRDAMIAEISGFAEIGVTAVASDIIATRGRHLSLSRIRSFVGSQPVDAFQAEAIHVIEIDADERISAIVVFDVEDIEAAFQELDARYLAGEAAAHARTWSVICGSYAAINRHEMPLTTPDCANIDHRRETAMGVGDLIAYISAGPDRDQDNKAYVEAVHRLTERGAVVTYAAHETSQEGFDAEWRGIAIFTVEGDMVSRTEVFDEADLDAAIARFDQLSQPAPRLENAASQVTERFAVHLRARDWDGMAELLADDFCSDDRRGVVGAGIQHGRDAHMADMRTIVDLWITNVSSTIIATRGERLVLMRTHFSGSDQGPGAFLTEVFGLVEIDTDERIVAIVSFDLEDFDAAIAELDDRYLASEGAAHAHVWSVIASGFASMRRYELPPTTPDCVSIDHRRTAAFAPGELNAYFRAAFDLTADVKIYVEAVHRLNDVGTVCTHVTYGVSHEGFAAEWREVDVLMVEGNIVNHCEIFDEADIDDALAKFEELSPHERRLKNAASRASDRYLERVVARDWDAIAEMLAGDYYTDDRRHVVGGGIYDRDAEIVSVQVQADLGVTHAMSTVIAIRGERLALSRVRYSGRNQELEPFLAEMLIVFEINADDRFAAAVAFDLEDIDAAFEELDARYLAGEAAAHAQTWSVISRGNAAANRNARLPMTPDSSMIDHRLRTTLNADGITAYVRATWDLTPELHMFIESVHRLNDVGTVVTHASHGTSQDDFEAEWRQITLFTVEGDLCNRCEIFDEANLDAALARFEELHPQARRLKNAATGVQRRLESYFAARDWEAMAETLVADISMDDRRRVVGAGRRQGRDAVMAELSALAEMGVTSMTPDLIAIRGAHLVLSRVRNSGRDQRPDAFRTDVLDVLEVDADGLVVARVVFDPDDIDAAFEELDARYLAGEAAAHSHTWSVISQAYAALNRRALPATTPDWANVDHRHFGTIEPNALTPNIRAFWDITSEARIDVATVHRLTNLGAVVAHATHATSQEGVEVESGEIIILMVDGDLLSRCEIFNEADLDAALARFEELHPQAPRLENAASQVHERFLAHFAARDWDAMAAGLRR